MVTQGQSGPLVFGCWSELNLGVADLGTHEDSLLVPSYSYLGGTLTLALGHWVVTLWHFALGLHSQLTEFPMPLTWAGKPTCHTQQQAVSVPTLCHHDKPVCAFVITNLRGHRGGVWTGTAGVWSGDWCVGSAIGL